MRNDVLFAPKCTVDVPVDGSLGSEMDVHDLARLRHTMNAFLGLAVFTQCESLTEVDAVSGSG